MDQQPATDAEVDLGGGVSPRAQGPLRYVNAIISIAKLDTEEIVRLSRDPKALPYGAVVFLVTNVLSVFLGSVLAGLAPNLTLIVVAPILGLIASAVTTGLVHLLAKVLFGATGSLVGLLRVLWLGSPISLVSVVPLIGPLVGGIWNLLITMVTFQEVDEIERLQALGLSIVVGLGFYAILRAIAV